MNRKSFMTSHKKSTTDPLKTASKKAIQKPAEKTDDLKQNKILDKIMSAASQKTSSKSTLPAEPE